MSIHFLDNNAFQSALTLLHSHNFIFDLYRADKILKFFTDEMLNNAKVMLSSRSITDGDDYDVKPNEQ
jgi:hypothetical protein